MTGLMVLNLRKAMIEGLKKEVVCKENLQVSGCRFTKEERGVCHSQELQIPQARISKGKASVMLECAASFGMKKCYMRFFLLLPSINKSLKYV